MEAGPHRKHSKQEKRKQISTFKVILFFFRPYKLQVVLLLGLSVVVGGLEAANVATFYPILSSAFDTGSGGEGNFILSLLAAVVNVLPIRDTFIAYCVLFVLIAVLTFTATVITIRFRVGLGARLAERNQIALFSKLIKGDYQYFIDHKQGEVIYNAATAPQYLSNLINAVTDLVSRVVLAISLLFLLLSLSWQGTLVVLLIVLGYYYFTKYLGRKISYLSGKGEMEAVRAGNVILNEAINGIKHVKVYVTGEDWLDRFSNTAKRRWHYFMKNTIWQQIPAPLLMLTLYLSIGITAMMIKIFAPESFSQLIPLLGTFAFAGFKLFPIVGSLGMLTMRIMGALPNCEVVYFILNSEITRIQDGEKELRSFTSGIRFDNITFAYKQNHRILDGISITFEKGKTTAIVGRSGTGKTTIINLLLRLFETSEGKITVDSLEIKEYKLSSWLSKIGFVSQDTFIFNDTIRNNITFYFKEYTDEEIINAARYADAHDFITKLSNGYDTLVGDKGIRLSGGQGQRIAVARAIIRKPEILIFDEATNALDSISEAAVQKAIDKVSKDHTVIIVAHRLSTIVNADKIIVLGNGRVVEEGTHEELMEKGGTYRELYAMQRLE